MGTRGIPEVLSPTDFIFIKASFLEFRNTETSLIYIRTDEELGYNPFPWNALPRVFQIASEEIGGTRVWER